MVDKNNCKLSIIITSVNGFPIVGECLDSLHEQTVIEDIEVIVANRCTNGVGKKIKKEYPWVKLIEAQPWATIPQMRVLAFREKTGELVAVLEDHCLVKKDWAQLIIDTHNSGFHVIGGAVENAARDKLVDWAAFFCEYSQYMKPIPQGIVEQIPGNNVSYKKWVIERFMDQFESGIWDREFHEIIKRSGISLYSEPNITVYHKMSASLSWFILQKFFFAKAFAGTRFNHQLYFYRFIYGCGSLFLPFILALRITFRVWNKRKNRRIYFLSFPIMIILLLSWGIGESAGYFMGPGLSQTKVS